MIKMKILKQFLQNILKIIFLSLLLHVRKKFKIKNPSFVLLLIEKILYLKMN